MSCPSDEDLAALLDGKVETVERDRILEHVSSCADCFRLFCGTIEYRVAHTQESSTRRARSWLLGSAAAAALFAAVSVAAVVWRGADSPSETAETAHAWVGIVVSAVPSGTISEGLWPAPQRRTRSADRGPLESSCFRAGVLAVGILVQLEEGRIESARSRLSVLREIAILRGITVPDTSGNDVRADLEALLRELERAPNGPAGARLLSLGAWAEAGRIAAREGALGLFESPEYLARSEEFLDPSLPRETRERVERIRRLASGERGTALLLDLEKLERTFTQILLTSSD